MFNLVRATPDHTLWTVNENVKPSVTLSKRTAALERPDSWRKNKSQRNKKQLQPSEYTEAIEKRSIQYTEEVYRSWRKRMWGKENK